MTVELFYSVDQTDLLRTLDRMDSGLSATGWAGFLAATFAPYLRARVQQRFEDEGDDVTGSWAPLKPATQEIRRQLGYGPAHPINVRTGELERFMTSDPGLVTRWAATAGLDFPNLDNADAELTEKITTAQGANPRVTARPVVGVNSTDMMFLLEAMSVYAQKVISGPGMP